MKSLLRFWFTFELTVSRGQYLVHGLALMVIKYLTDAALIRFGHGVVWLPADYVSTGTQLAQSKLAGAPGWLPIVLAAWTIPFMWVGLTLTSRRARDARVSPWLALVFFVPVLNYVGMAVLSLLPTGAPRPIEETPKQADAGHRADTMAAIAAGALSGWILTAAAVLLLKSYGAGLFLGTPFVMGAVTAFVQCRRYEATPGETFAAVFWAFAVAAFAMLLFAVEGLVCLIMAAPFALGVGWLGAALGRSIARHERNLTPAVLVVVIFPLTMPMIDARTPAAVREVRTSIEINAPADVVWVNVVTFPRLAPPRDLIFRAGIAHPLGARIEGAGVGATRYCVFNTGEFVEPITAWEPGRRLGFDIVKNPAPMRELSPYKIAPPHLDGWFRATRGEFRLSTMPDGHTRIDGSTWYALDIHPAPYFALIADYIVGRIHERVLEHIKDVSERR